MTSLGKTRASRALENAAARWVAESVFGNTSAAAIGISRRRLDTISSANGVEVIVLDRDGRRAGKFDSGGRVVPMTVADLAAQLRGLYPRDGLLSHRTLAAHLGLSNRALSALLHGSGIESVYDGRLGHYQLAPGQLEELSARSQRTA